MSRNSGPAACHLKGHKEERLVESLLSVGCWQLGGGRVQRADACPADNQVMLLQREGEGYMQKLYSQVSESSWNWSLVVWPASPWLLYVQFIFCSQRDSFSSNHVWMWELYHRESLSAEELMLLKCGAGEDSWESQRLQGDQTSQS